MIHFLRLIRPINLFVIALIMYSLRFYFFSKESLFMNHEELQLSRFEQTDFFLLVFSTVIIAAGGNIINDYFDVKADKINKPHKVIIGRYIKPRVAIVTHWILNFIAFSIAVYLSFKFDTFWYVFIHLLSINLLWIYSMKLKRKFLIGNVVVSFLTALVPFLTMIYFFHTQSYKIYSVNNITITLMLFVFTLVFSGYAFILNLVREIIKDLEDVEGDLILRAKTLPIKFGEKKSRIIALVILLLVIFSSILGLTFSKELFHTTPRTFDIAIFGFIAFFLLLAIFFLKSPDRKQLKYADRSLKVAMIIGSLLPLIWSLIVVKG